MIYCRDGGPSVRALRKTFIILLAVLLIIPVMSVKAFAASPLTVSGGSNVKGGDTFTMAITFGNGSVGRVDAQLTYDTNKLSYISGGSSTGNTGFVSLKKAGTEGSVTFNIKFQALSEGNASVEVSTNELYDLDEVYLDGDTPSVSKTISIAGSAEPEQVITEEGPTEETVPTTELKGVDEKPDDEAEDGAVNLNIILIIAAAVLVALIVVISIVLAKKKKKNGGAGAMAARRRDDGMDYDGDGRYGHDDARYSDAGYDRYGDNYRDDRYDRYDDRYGDDYRDDRYDRYDRYGDGGRYDNRYGDDRYSDDRYGGSERRYDDYRDDPRTASREEKRNIRKRASEETELWDDWKGFDDDDRR